MQKNPQNFFFQSFLESKIPLHQHWIIEIQTNYKQQEDRLIPIFFLLKQGYKTNFCIFHIDIHISL